MLRRFTTKKPESPTPVVVVPPDIAHPAALALQTAARGMTARRLRTELAEGSKAARRHGFLLIVAERAYLWRLQLLTEHFEAPLRAAAGSGALPADAARSDWGAYPKQAKLWAHAGEVRTRALPASERASERVPQPPLHPFRTSHTHRAALLLRHRSTLSASSRPTRPSCYCR